MYSIDFIKLETHGKLSFSCSDFWQPIRPAATTYKKDGVKRRHNFRHFRHLLEQLDIYNKTYSPINRT
jgi:hypothetical protein